MDDRPPRCEVLLRIFAGCDDCTAWTDLVDHGGVLRLEISHDHTCPAYAGLTRRRRP